MDTETLEKLIDGQPAEVKVRGVTLFNGAIRSASLYRESPTAANLRDWQASEAALKEFEARLRADQDAEKPFATLADVLDYLVSSGWRITKTSLYRHHREGKISPQRDGAYAVRDVDRYARAFLKETATGKKVSAKVDELQRQKLERELANLDLEIKRKALAYDRDTQRVINRDLVEIELAGRAAVLDAGLKHWIQSRAAEWTRLVAGDIGKVSELVNLMTRDVDEHLNSYASPIEYQVVLDAQDSTLDEPGEEES